MIVVGQSLNVTFTTSADSISVDSVLATNLNTNQSVVIPGNETLILEQSSGIEHLTAHENNINLYPNPFNSKSTLVFGQSKGENVRITLHNIAGQTIYLEENYLEAGEHHYELSVNKEGIYLINITSANETFTYKAICTESQGFPVEMNHIGFSYGRVLKTSLPTSNQNQYKLAYSPDQVMHFECCGGKHTNIFTDTVVTTIDYEVEFFDCTDPDGRTYNVVKIGDQVWMEENLAYLPEINSPPQGSDTIKHYYVYDYEGNNVKDAKSTDQYMKYGVLYNWCATLDGDSLSEDNTTTIQGICPDGWHLPSSEEFSPLTNVYVTWRSNLRSTEEWVEGWNGNNRTGFNAYPGGYRANYGTDTFFKEVHAGAFFWTTTLFESDEPVWDNYVRILKLLMFGQIGERPGWSNFSEGLSVRCIKDE